MHLWSFLAFSQYSQTKTTTTLHQSNSQVCTVDTVHFPYCCLCCFKEPTHPLPPPSYSLTSPQAADVLGSKVIPLVLWPQPELLPLYTLSQVRRLGRQGLLQTDLLLSPSFPPPIPPRQISGTLPCPRAWMLNTNEEPKQEGNKQGET